MCMCPHGERGTVLVLVNIKVKKKDKTLGRELRTVRNQEGGIKRGAGGGGKSDSQTAFNGSQEASVIFTVDSSSGFAP